MPLVLTILFYMLPGCNQNITGTITKDTSILYQYWIHSHEEDSKESNPVREYKTYRPAAYHFPPARGRDGFEIKQNGIFISHPIASTDGNKLKREKWKLENDTLIVTGKTISTFKIISLGKEKLVLELLQTR